MIYKLGKVVSKTKSNLIFESNYTGYVISVIDIDRFEINKFQKIFIYEYKNDYSQNYYGFKEFKERIIFEDLISIPGVGPKTAMSVLTINWKKLISLIAEGDYEELSKIPYVSLKVARQIVFDFQKKYKTIMSKKTENKNKLEVFKTLKTLGFTDKQIDLVSNKLEDINDIDKMVQNAIEMISYEQQSNINKA